MSRMSWRIGCINWSAKDKSIYLLRSDISTDWIAAYKKYLHRELPRWNRTSTRMAKTEFKSVDEYIASQPETMQAVLEHVRRTIRKAVPEAEEVISYKMPTYKLQGAPVLYFAGWKQYFSLYPATAKVIAEFGDEIAPHIVNKSTIRSRYRSPSR